MGLNAYQRNLVFTGGTVLAVGVLGYGAYILGAIHLEHVKQARVAESLRVENAKIADAKARVTRLLALSICAPLDATEQTYLNNVEMDPEKTKQLLIAFHRKRLDSCRALMSGTDRERAYWDRVQRNGSSDLRDDEEPKERGIAYLRADGAYKAASRIAQAFAETIDKIEVSVQAPLRGPDAFPAEFLERYELFAGTRLPG